MSAGPNAGLPSLAALGDDAPSPGLGLCLSGGGYRAMLFHVGGLWRLNEAGFLPLLQRVAGVSAGAIPAAVLGEAWARLKFDGSGVAEQCHDEVVVPLRRLASKTIDVGAALEGVLGVLIGRGSPGEHVHRALRKLVLGDRTLADLPEPGAGPSFVISATELGSGRPWRFSRERAPGDGNGESWSDPAMPLAAAVAASCAGPPVLAPLALEFHAPAPDAPDAEPQPAPPAAKVLLTDGGVGDQLGLGTVWERCRTVLVSDGGSPARPEQPRRWDWPRQSSSVLALIDQQLRDRCRRELLDALGRGTRRGAYWGIASDPAAYPAPAVLDCPTAATAALAQVPARLQALPALLQERLVNWGYASCDLALRGSVDRTLPAPAQFPYPAAGVG